MSLDINNFKNINTYFGDVIDKMEDGLIKNCLKNDRKFALINFDKMLGLLKDSNIQQLIDEYKKSGIRDKERFYSLLSEIRAGVYLSFMDFSVEYLKTKDNKTPDIKTKIAERTAFIEVKRISERAFQIDKVSKELQSRKLNYDILLSILKKIYSASDVVDSFINSIPKNIPKDFGEYVRFEFGEYKIRQKKKIKPILSIGVSYTVPATKSDRKKGYDSNISRQEIEGGIISDLDNAISKFNEHAKNSDLCFVFLDNIDVFHYGYGEFNNFLYGGSPVYISTENGEYVEMPYQIIPEAESAKKLGWDNLLKTLGFIPPKIDFSLNKGWYLYSLDSTQLNGIFHIIAYDFTFKEVYCFLNPFVKKDRNLPVLQDLFHIYND